MKKRTIGTLLAALLMAGGAVAQNNGGIDAEMYKEISESYKPTTSEKALQNILMGNPIKPSRLTRRTCARWTHTSAIVCLQRVSQTRNRRAVAGSSPE